MITRHPNQKPQSVTPQARVIAVVNQKGGVGKTTTAINLSAYLALAGLPTLLLDCDPQANTTGGLGLKRNSPASSIYEVLSGNTPLDQAITTTCVDNLALVPGSRNLIGANLELVREDRREFRLRDALAPVLSSYRYIVIDCPPALDLLTLNALVAAGGLLVPMQAEYFALEGISELVNTLDSVSASFNPGLALEGVLLTMFDERTNLSQQVANNLRDFFGDKLFRTTIPRNIRLAEAPSHGQPVALYDPRSRGAEAYADLAAELLVRHGLRAPAPRRTSLAPADEPSKPARKSRFWNLGAGK